MPFLQAPAKRRFGTGRPVTSNLFREMLIRRILHTSFINFYDLILLFPDDA
ncbi:MAG: hypothetical protein ACKO85_06705 [Isosphaeraceae bacterium]